MPKHKNQTSFTSESVRKILDKRWACNRAKWTKSKVCSVCGIKRAREMFDTDRSRGIPRPVCRCKLCSAKLFKAWASKNRKRRNETNKQYNLRHPEVYQKWKELNREHLRDLERRWRKANQRRRLAIHQTREIRKRGTSSIEDQRDINEFYELIYRLKIVRCYWCGKRVAKQYRQADHVVAIAKGGKHSVVNLVCACRNCNLRKSTKTAFEFSGQGELVF